MFQRPATVVTVVAVTFALAGIMRCSTRNVTAERASNGEPRIDSARYQREIAALESTLYRDAPPSMSDFMTISTAFDQLGFAIGTREVNPALRAAAEDVLLLAASADVGEAGYVLPDITALRADWESLRAQRFAGADWFRQSSPELDQAQVVPPPSVDPSFADDLLRVLDEIAELAQEGRSACAALGEPFYDFELPGAEGSAHIEEWNQFARVWDDDVTTAASHLPPPPPWDGDPELTAAYQDAAGALRELRLATMGAGSWPVPMETEWTARFDEADRLVQESRSRLSAR